MFKELLCIVIGTLAISSAVFSQGSVRGTITDDQNGEPLPGVNVIIQETQQGTATDAEGNYIISSIEPGVYTLVATFVGFDQYNTQIEIESGELIQNIELQLSVYGLEDVVVTAFGIQREQRSLGYSSQNVRGEQLSSVRETNFVNTLQGK